MRRWRLKMKNAQSEKTVAFADKATYVVFNTPAMPLAVRGA